MGIRDSFYLLTAALILQTAGQATLRAAGPQSLTGRPWIDMDYGPMLSASIEAPHPATNIAYKGIAIRLGQASGSPQEQSVLFDTDLLRYAAGWSGGFLSLKGVVFDGEHWAYPKIRGAQFLGNPAIPGWAKAGQFDDPRDFPYGPLPRDWAHWQGLYLHRNQVVLSYAVGDMSVWEMPGLERAQELTALTRTLNLGPSRTGQAVQVAFDSEKQRAFLRLDDLQPAPSDTAANEILVLLAPPRFPAQNDQPTPAALEKDLLGRWEFEETDPATAKNLSGPLGPITLHGVGRTQNGQSGGALEFQRKQYGEIEPAQGLDFLRTDLTIAAWIKTAADGTILAKTARTNRWVPNGVSWFVRDGRLTFDVGWVGDVQSSQAVGDDRWHHVALVWSHEDGMAILYVDGQPDGSARLQPKAPLPSQTVRIGYTSPNFPASPWFVGQLDDLRIYARRLSEEELVFLANTTGGPALLAVGVVGAMPGARWMDAAQGHVRLHLPAHQDPANLKLLIAGITRESLDRFAALVRNAPPPQPLEPLTQGGPARWPEKLITEGQLGTGPGPYVIDTLTAPDINPWNSWMRFGGVDFFSDNRRAAISTWNGDVWIVSGVDGNLERLTWQRIATGLFQPLGLKIVQDRLYVLGRDQITLLQDLNGDGEADFYQNFNNDCMVSEHFHEFATDLKTDQEGNFYYIKCARHARDALHPHHGTLLKLPPDGSKLEIVARGLRAVNGLGVGPNGELTCVDNQGHWMPGNRINWIKPGGFYGNMWAWNPDRRTDYDLPLCWMHNFVDRSGGTHLWVPTDQWGPLQNELITISYGMGHIFLVLKEEVGELRQGGVTRFPLDFETGVMRGVFHPVNHQLYTCGLYGWAGNKTKPGGFYRVRYTGRPLYMPNQLRITSDGILLGFTDPLEISSATDPGNYDVKAWNYRWTEQYGSPDFKMNGQEGRESWRVESATLSADHKQVFLKVPAIQLVMQMHILVNLKAADGSPVRNFVHNTIHQLGSEPGLSLLGAGAVARGPEMEIILDQESPGLIQTFSSKAEPDMRDTRQARLAALYVPADSPPTPFLEPGPFQTIWHGFLKLDLNEEAMFQTEGRGTARLEINGQVVLDTVAQSLENIRSQPVPLRSGLNRFRLTYQSPDRGAAEFRLFWTSKHVPLEPVPPTIFVHDSTDPDLQRVRRIRHGRSLFGMLQCAQCHRPEESWEETAMPELAMDAPALNRIGSRLNQDWMERWILDPKSFRENARMPRCLTSEQSAVQARDIAAFLGSLQAPADAVLSRGPEAASIAANGETLFTELGCIACHRFLEDPILEKDPRLSLDPVKAKWQEAALVSFLRAPSQHYQWIRMPDFQLSAEEASALKDYLVGRGRPASPAPPQASQPDRNRGRELVITQGCLACHNLEGETNRLAAPSLAALAESTWQRGCLADPGSSQGNAPDFGFTETDRNALRAFGWSETLESLSRSVPAEFAARQYETLQCNACHGRDNETDLWSALQATGPSSAPTPPIDDEEEAFLSAEGGSVHIGRPPLTFAGEKLWAGWMERFLTGRLPYKPRPTLQGRMPAVPAYAKDLAAGLAHQHGYAAVDTPVLSVDLALARIGQGLTGLSEGFSCISCHDVGDQKALAGKDTATVNFAAVADRLRPSYYWRYVQDPPHILPSTMMPKFINEDGSTPIKSVYGGDPQRQFTAIWHYLQSLRNTWPSPPQDTPKPISN